VTVRSTPLTPEGQLAYFDRAAKILRQHRPAMPDLRNIVPLDFDPDFDDIEDVIRRFEIAPRCICGAQFRPSGDYDDAVAEHQAAEIAQAAGHDYPLGATR
jgi:hypothetical protein